MRSAKTSSAARSPYLRAALPCSVLAWQRKIRSRSAALVARAIASDISALSADMLAIMPCGFMCVTLAPCSAAIACSAPIW